MPSPSSMFRQVGPARRPGEKQSQALIVLEQSRPGRGLGVAQSVELLTLDFRSGHDLMAGGIEPCIGFCAEGVKPVWGSLPHSLCLSHTHAVSLSK